MAVIPDNGFGDDREFCKSLSSNSFLLSMSLGHGILFDHSLIARIGPPEATYRLCFMAACIMAIMIGMVNMESMVVRKIQRDARAVSD